MQWVFLFAKILGFIFLIAGALLFLAVWGVREIYGYFYPGEDEDDAGDR